MDHVTRGLFGQTMIFVEKEIMAKFKLRQGKKSDNFFDCVKMLKLCKSVSKTICF